MCSLTGVQGHCYMNESIAQGTKAEIEKSAELGKLYLNHLCIYLRTFLWSKMSIFTDF